MTETGSISDPASGSCCSPTSSGGSIISNSNGHGESHSDKRKGKCKWFNVAKGWGFITPLDGSQEVFVHQSVLQMSGFRSLGDDEEVEFECKESDKGLEATFVCGPQGNECQGSHRRPMSSKKKVKKIRCYNCGELAHHIASKCTLGPQPKKCHSCKSEDHLIGDCPKKSEKDQLKTRLKTKENSENHIINGSGNSLGSSPINSETPISTDELHSE